MLKTRVIEKIRPSKKILELFNSNQLKYTSVNGYIKVIEKTNILQIYPVIYNLDNLTIYEFPKEYAKKEFYIVNNNTSYTLNELKSYIFG